MDKWFDNKWFVRAVSLAFAILLYVVVDVEMTSIQSDQTRVPSSSNAVQTLNDVPVDIRIDGEQYVVSGVPETISVTLEGPNSILVPTVRQRNFDVFVDLQGLGEGEHTVEIEHTKLPNELAIYIEPKSIPITIEERATEEFPVLIDYINLDELPPGYELGEVEVSPETITVTSSRSVIDQIAMVKVFVDVGGLTESINNREVPVNVYDSQGNGLNVRVNPSSVVVSVDVENPSKNVPITVDTVGDLPDDYELISITVDPDEIEVFAVSGVLDEIEEIVTEEIDLSTITSSGTIEVKLVIPDDAYVENETIEVEIEIEQTKEIENVPIEVENLGTDQSIEFINSDEQVTDVKVSGTEEIVRNLSVDDINTYIDVNDLTEGDHTVPVMIEGPDGVNIEVDLNEVKISIT